jgi:hypothetical protein
MVGVRDVLLVCGPGLVALGVASAQPAPQPGRVAFTAGVGAMYGNLMGGDFAGSKAAAGVDANAGVVLHRWQLGIGYDRTNHRHDGTDGDYIVSNAYVEPRLLFPGARRWTPYAAARFGRAMASYEGALGLTEKASGLMAGVGAGLVWSLATHVQADAAAYYARLSHEYDTDGFSATEKGGQASLRVGLRYGTR